MNFKSRPITFAHLPQARTIGNIQAPLSSLISHKCLADAARLYLPGPKVVVFALKPIKKGAKVIKN